MHLDGSINLSDLNKSVKMPNVKKGIMQKSVKPSRNNIDQTSNQVNQSVGAILTFVTIGSEDKNVKIVGDQIVIPQTSIEPQ